MPKRRRFPSHPGNRARGTARSLWGRRDPAGREEGPCL